MSRYQIQALMRIKHVIHQLRALDGATLSPTEHGAWRDMLDQAYDRAAYFLHEENRRTDQRQGTDEYLLN
jgi:hypothetical protein